MATTSRRAIFQKREVHEGSLRVPAGTVLVKQNVPLPITSGGGVGHVYQHAPTGQWFTVGAGPRRGSWTVCTYIGAACPCGG